MSWPRNGRPTRVAEGIIQLAREINYTVMSRDEYEGRQQREDAFLESIWQNKRVSLITRT